MSAVFLTMGDFAKPGPSTINLVPSGPVDAAVHPKLSIVCQKDGKVRFTSENEGPQMMRLLKFAVEWLQTKVLEKKF